MPLTRHRIDAASTGGCSLRSHPRLPSGRRSAARGARQHVAAISPASQNESIATPSPFGAAAFAHQGIRTGMRTLLQGRPPESPDSTPRRARNARTIRTLRIVSYATVAATTQITPAQIPAPTSLIQCTPR